MTWLKRVGLTLLAIGLVSVLVVFVLPAAHNWTPVRMPISLASGTLTSPEFRTDLDTNYEINIEVDRKIDPEKLDCLLGNQAFFLKPCKAVPNLIDISWTVASHGQTIVTGSSDDVHDGAWGPTVERTIGRFRARKGSRYVVHLNVRKDASELNTTNPRLTIAVHPREYERNMTWAMLAASAVWPSILLGVLLLGIFGLVRVFRKRKDPSSPDMKPS